MHSPLLCAATRYGGSTGSARAYARRQKVSGGALAALDLLFREAHLRVQEGGRRGGARLEPARNGRGKESRVGIQRAASWRRSGRSAGKGVKRERERERFTCVLMISFSGTGGFC